ncbi:regulatory protein, luxR family [Streptosporangium subroseum]|uniref:Regulatory protein, luxR family n=1 Tax=Streptosporangium subroseum TaxID=106412 RepID=A0A239HZK6_9ACTN|nr:regulatory protein, luxR family [Streptosporangium subroseum]
MVGDGLGGVRVRRGDRGPDLLRPGAPRPHTRGRAQPATDLLAAIRVVVAGESLLAPTVTRRLIAEFLRHPRPAPAGRDLGGITQREREVLTLIGRGMSNSEIAEHLHLTVGTVKTHISRLLAKLHGRDRAQLVIAAYEGGLVNPSPQ